MTKIFLWCVVIAPFLNALEDDRRAELEAKINAVMAIGDSFRQPSINPTSKKNPYFFFRDMAEGSMIYLAQRHLLDANIKNFELLPELEIELVSVYPDDKDLLHRFRVAQVVAWGVFMHNPPEQLKASPEFERWITHGTKVDQRWVIQGKLPDEIDALLVEEKTQSVRANLLKVMWDYTRRYQPKAKDKITAITRQLRIVDPHSVSKPPEWDEFLLSFIK